MSGSSKYNAIISAVQPSQLFITRAIIAATSWQFDFLVRINGKPVLCNATINAKHRIDLPALLRVLNALGLEDDSPFPFVWVLPLRPYAEVKAPGGLASTKDYTSEELSSLRGRIVQYKLCIPVPSV